MSTSARFVSRIAQSLSSRSFLALLAAGLFVVGTLASVSGSTEAAVGINKKLNYQGRLLNTAGAVVPDGNYNIQFKIYQDGAGTTAGNPGGSLEWTEEWLNNNTQGVTVKNGYFSVALGTITTTLGSDVDFNQDTLWLSVNVGNTSTCTPFTSCGGDGEMLPMKRMSAAPYALQAANASALGGIASSGFIQNQSASPQTAVFHIQSSGVNTTTAALRAISGQNSNVLEVRDDSGNAIAGVQASGAIFSAPSGTTIPSNARLFVQPLSSSSTAIVARAATSATGDIVQLQDSGGSNILRVDPGANLESIGYMNNGIGGIGQFANLLTYSEQFDNAAWTKTNVTAPTADTILAPDGKFAAESLADSASGGSVSQTSGTTPTNDNYTFSIWLKTASGTQSAALRIDGATSGTGTVKTVTASTTWQRFSVTQNTNGFTGNIKPMIFPGGTGGTGTVHAWGGQLVLANNPQVYVRSTASTVAANQGVVSNGGAFISSINATDVPLVVQAAPSQTGDLLQLQNSAGTAMLNFDSVNQKLVVRAKTDTGTLGSELVTSQAFNNGTYWTTCNSSGWTGTATTATHASGTTACIATNTNFTVTAGVTYQVTFTVSGLTSGLVTPRIGSTDGLSITTNSPNQTQLITAADTGSLQFVPRTDFVGTISGVFVKALTTSNSTFSVNNSDNTPALEVRTGGSGKFTTAIGNGAFRSNVSGSDNTAVGDIALRDSTTGNQNTAVGSAALQGNTNGNDNTGLGYGARAIGTSGSGNTSVGSFSHAVQLIAGSNNTALGFQAGNSDLDTFFSYDTTNSTAVGAYAQVQADNSLILGGAGQHKVNVGIGTTMPNNTLSVAPVRYDIGTASTSGASTTITGSGTSWLANASVGDEIIFDFGWKRMITAVNSNTQIIVDSSITVPALSKYRIHYAGLQVTSAGKVGVGTTAPTANLQVSTLTNTSTAFQVQNASGSAALTVDTTSLNSNVSNPSFEVNTTGWVASGTGASIARNTTEKYVGGASLAFTTGTAVGNSARLTVGTALSTSTTYTMSFYGKAGTAFSTLSASYSPDGTAANERECAMFSPSGSVVTTGWTRYTCTINTSSTAATASGYIAIKQSDATSRVLYIDAVQIEAGSAITQAAIANIGFETNTTGWLYVGTPGSIARSTADDYNGAASMLITTTNTANDGAKYTTANSNPTQLATNTSYTLSFWAKAVTNSVTNLAAAYARDGSTQTNCTLSSNTVSTTAWGVYTCSFTTDGTGPAAGAYVIIKQSTAPGAGGRTWYVDDVQLTRTSFIGTGMAFQETGMALNGVINSPTAFRNQSDSVSAFQVQSAAGTSVFNVDTLNQRVGIGVANPQEKLHMDGKLRFVSPKEDSFDGNAKLFVGTGPDSSALGTLNSTSQTLIDEYGGGSGVDASGLVMQWGGGIDSSGFKLSNDGMMLWGSGDTDIFKILDEDDNELRMVMDTSGNVAIGTDSPANGVDLHVASTNTDTDDDGSAVVRIGANNGVAALQLAYDEIGCGTCSAWAFVNASGTGGNLEIIEDKPVGTFNRQADYIRTATNGGGSWFNASDSRLKNSITTLSVLDKIDTLRGVNFYWNYNDDIRQVGVIAQEMQQAFPEVVSTGSKGYLAVDYNGVAAIALQGVKELDTAVDDIRQQTAQAAVNGGDARFATLNISGRTTLDTLTVKGEAVFESKVTVKELVAQNDLTVNGHVISGGNTPAIVAAQNNQVAIEGTDTAGTITITPEGVAAGELANITFTKAYAKVPRITITGTNAAGSMFPVYPEKTATGFKLLTEMPPVAGTSYRYDYIVIE